MRKMHISFAICIVLTTISCGKNENLEFTSTDLESTIINETSDTISDVVSTTENYDPIEFLNDLPIEYLVVESSMNSNVRKIVNDKTSLFYEIVEESIKRLTYEKSTEIEYMTQFNKECIRIGLNSIDLSCEMVITKSLNVYLRIDNGFYKSKPLNSSLYNYSILEKELNIIISGQSKIVTRYLIDTPVGSMIHGMKFESDFSTEEQRKIDDYVSNKYQSAIKLKSSSLLYNAYSYAFLGTDDIWLNEPFKFIEDNSYYEVDSPSQGDVIVYYDNKSTGSFDDDIIVHAGVVTELTNLKYGEVCGTSNSVIVASKWGTYGLYSHRGDQCPYTSTYGGTADYVKYYRVHNHDYEYLESEDIHIKSCSCGFVLKTNHSYRDGFCKYCNAEETHIHSYYECQFLDNDYHIMKCSCGYIWNNEVHIFSTSNSDERKCIECGHNIEISDTTKILSIDDDEIELALKNLQTFQLEYWYIYNKISVGNKYRAVCISNDERVNYLSDIMNLKDRKYKMHYIRDKSESGINYISANISYIRIHIDEFTDFILTEDGFIYYQFCSVGANTIIMVSYASDIYYKGLEDYISSISI